MSSSAPTLNNHLHSDKWPPWQAVHGSVAVRVQLGDVLGRHLEEPHTDKLPFWQQMCIGRVTVCRPRDVLGRAGNEALQTDRLSFSHAGGMGVAPSLSPW